MMTFVNVTKENLEEEHICCALSGAEATAFAREAESKKGMDESPFG